jgi:hypothetical protein
MTRFNAARVASILATTALMGAGVIIIARHSCAQLVPFSCSGPDPELVELVELARWFPVGFACIPSD